MDKVNLMGLLKKGAEADLYAMNWHGRKAVLKMRMPKQYRSKRLDTQIRTYRTMHEPQLMHEAKKAGVPSPAIFFVDVRNAVIVMEFVEGKQVKQLLDEVSAEDRSLLCFKIGQEIGRLHRFGLVHGDLTTSNMIVDGSGKVFFLDFGLGERNDELEARGVDLHLMKRALQSTHYRFVNECFDCVIDGYGTIVDAETLKNVLRKIREIERRGRYVAERGQEVSV